MSGNTSASGGYLTPTGTPVNYDRELLTLLQPAVAAISGLDVAKVVQMWQDFPEYEVNVDWAAIAINDLTSWVYEVVQHNPTGNGTSIGKATEEFGLHCVFYGPHCQGYAARLRDGLFIAQNREVLDTQGLRFVDTSGLSYVPELLNQNIWQQRCDVTLNFRREVQRTYAVLNVLSSAGEVRTETAPPLPFSTEQ